ncbi:MAG: hypothetical protein ACI9P5_002593, partial [Saprospiraceae bacterium]
MNLNKTKNQRTTNYPQLYIMKNSFTLLLQVALSWGLFISEAQSQSTGIDNLGIEFNSNSDGSELNESVVDYSNPDMTMLGDDSFVDVENPDASENMMACGVTILGAGPTCTGQNITLTASVSGISPVNGINITWALGAGDLGSISPIIGLSTTYTPAASGGYTYEITATYDDGDENCTQTVINNHVTEVGTQTNAFDVVCQDIGTINLLDYLTGAAGTNYSPDATIQYTTVYSITANPGTAASLADVNVGTLTIAEGSIPDDAISNYVIERKLINPNASCADDIISITLKVEKGGAIADYDGVSNDIDGDPDYDDTDPLTETICHNTAPTVGVEVTTIDGNSYLITDIAIDNGVGAVITNTSTDPDNVPANFIKHSDLADVETNLLSNLGTTVGTVTYTITPYTYGPDGNDDSGITNGTGGDGNQDDCLNLLGKFEIVVTVEPAATAIADYDGVSDDLS